MKRSITETAQTGSTLRKASRGRRVYGSLERLYAHPRRRSSRERDVGLRWQAADGTTYRAAWIRDTRELYSVQHMSPDGQGGSVEVLGLIAPHVLEEAFAGWRDVCGEPRSYEWLCERASRYASHGSAPVRPRARLDRQVLPRRRRPSTSSFPFTSR